MQVTAFLKKYLFRIIVVLVMIGGLVYFFYDLDRTNDLGKAFLSFASANWLYLALGFLFMLISMILKAYRVFVLIKPTNPNLKFKKFLLPFFVGYGVGILGPFKSGELAAVEINKRALSIPRSTSVAALVFFNIFDLFVILIPFLIGLVTMIPRIVEDQFISYFNVIFYISLVGTIVLAIILFIPPVGNFVFKMLKAITCKISPKRGEWFDKKIKPALDNYYQSLRYLYKKIYLSVTVIGATIVRWLLEFYSFKLTIMAFGADISILDASAIISITLFVGLLTFVPAGLGTGTNATQFLLKELSIAPAIAGASNIYQMFVGTGVTLALAFISSFFIKEQKEESKLEEPSEQNKDKGELDPDKELE